MNREIAPHLYRAIEYLIEDQGDLFMGADEVVLPSKFEEDGPTIHWALVNKFLGTLGREELATFCIGDQEDQLALVKKHGIEADYAHTALDKLFEIIGT